VHEMKVALTVWGKRISPVFDSAQMLLISEIKNSKVIEIEYKPFNPEASHQLASLLNKQKISVLICGAISETPANMIETCGIKLISFISGSVHEVLQSYAQSKSIIPNYLMPGCNHKYQMWSKKEGGIMPGKNGTGQKKKGNGKGRRMSTDNCRNNSEGQNSESAKGQNKGSGCGRSRRNKTK